MFVSFGAWAQQKNVLSVPDAKVSIGQAQLPVAIENTDEIIAAQFDLTLPSTISAGTEAVAGNRMNGHTVIIRNMGATRYRVMLYSEENQPLLAQQGTVFYIPLSIPNTVTEGSELPLVISDATLTVAGGANVLTGTKAGKLIVSTLPDLTVKDVVATIPDASQTGIIPGERLSLSWQVQNVGGAETGGGWSEQILLVNKRGTVKKLLGTVYQQEKLAAGAVMSRQADIVVPQLLGIDGEAYLQVDVIAGSATGESSLATGNNSAQTVGTFTVGKRLFLEMTPARIVENYGRSVSVKVSRSGNWNFAQTFALSASADSRVTLPEQVTVPIGQSGAIVYMTIADNSVLDSDSIVTITAGGNGYANAMADFVIEDNEYPNLTLTASKSVLTEGESFQLHVTVSRVSHFPIEVTLTSENSKRFSVGEDSQFPTKVTIPAGETSAQISVTAINDELPSLDLSNAFTASAPKYNKGEAIVVLKDDDLPVLELTLTPTTVSESDGVVAVAGQLRRTTKTDSKITVKLSDDANGGLYFGNRTLELAKGVEEVNFNFGPVDNALLDGDRTYTITAAVWLSSCSCGASGESAGYVTSQLKVLDNDGAALTLTSSQSAVKEGGQVELTISRNTTDTTNPLTVTLNSDYEEGLTYQHSVTIPAGKRSVKVKVTSAANSAQGDSHTVVFTAQANGFATGTCFLMVTDQTMPDARISSITADATEVEVGAKVTLSIVVANEGASELPTEVPVKVYARGESNALGTIYTPEAIPIGGSLTLTKVVTLPTTIGTHRYYAVVNETDMVQELSRNNNTSADVAIATVAPYTVALQTDKAIYKQGEKVVITGQLSGNGIANTTAQLYVINEGARQVQNVVTDAQGAFTCEWQLYAQQFGHFVIGACYPGEGLKAEMASFDVYGMRRTENSYITCDVINGDTFSGTLNIFNPGTLSLTGVKAEVLSSPENCNASVSIPSVISGGQTIKLSYQLKGTEPSAGNDWGEVKVRVTTDEGVSLDVPLYFYCRSARGKLLASTNNIVTSMVKGKTREYNLQVTNVGRGNTGTVSLALPDFIKSLSGITLPSLDQNDTIDISLTFTPTEEMQPNVPVTGQLGINCENGDGTAISFRLTPVSEETGTLLVDVCDENTYYTAEAPHLQDAQVLVRDYSTSAIISQGQTDSDGKFAVILPSGYYNLFVTAANHDTYTNNIFVEPGVVTKKTINLSIQSIEVNWKVEETQVEDEYEIVTTVQYETNVPVPIVETNVPGRIYTENLAVGESLIFYAILTNKGLITAQNTTLTLPSQTGDLLWEPLMQNEGLELLPQQSITIPCKVTRISTDEGSGRRKARTYDENGCYIDTDTKYVWKCGSDFKWHRYTVPVQYRVCPREPSKSEDPHPTNPDNPSPHVGPYIDPIYPGPPVGPNPNNPPNPYTPRLVLPEIPLLSFEHCIPCIDHYLDILYGCAVSKLISDLDVPFLGCAMGAKECADQLMSHTGGWRRNVNCVLTGVGCLAELCEDVAKGLIPVSGGSSAPVAALCSSIGTITDIASCLTNLTEPCHPDAPPTSRRKASEGSDEEPSYITALRQASGVASKGISGFNDVMLECFGDSAWLTNTTIEEQFEMLTELAVNTDEYLTVDALRPYKPEGITEGQLAALVERLNNSTRYDKTGEESGSRIHQENIDNAWEKMGEAQTEAVDMGYADMNEMFQTVMHDSYKSLVDGSESVCATITLQFTQKMTMTRQAFRGTLTVFNGNTDTAMEDVKLKLKITNLTNGEVATSHEFQINAESLDGFSGELNLGSGWTLTANSTGTATILFIPTKYAAPTEPVEWSFGGTLSYLDPFTGLEVTRDLYPVTLTVKPSPELDLTYFMQRDVYGDDPLTEEVEPMVPAEFALLINNIGYGDATNVRLTTNQPEIVENEKGLLIDFEILSAQLNGGDKTLALGGSVATDFGTIPAHSQTYAQWWLQSSLLGHFTDYDVQATHVTSYGNPDLSLLNNVTIHELIRSIKVADGGVTGFVVNDVPDAGDTPDIVYFTDGTTANVVVANNATWEKQSSTEYLLTVTPSETGWNYGHVTDPTFGRAKLIGIRRQSDGKEISLRNFWQTDRTLRDGKDWLYENNLHFVDMVANAAETYVLTFEPRPDTQLQVASFEGVPEASVVLREPLQTVTVTFNKAIDASTFTREDISLFCQGVRLDNPIPITSLSDTQFKLDLSQIEGVGGYYVLTVQTAGITDFEGFNGQVGKSASWILFTETTLALTFYDAAVTYGNNFTEPRVLTNSVSAPAFSSTNPLVASVDAESGNVTINAVGTTEVNVRMEETPMSAAAQTSYRLTVLQPEGYSAAPSGIETVSITIPEGQSMTTYCSPWPIDFSGATDNCRAYTAVAYHDDIVECLEATESKGGIGLLIVGNPGTYTFPVRTSFYDPMENLFVGTLAPTYVEKMTDDLTNLGLKDIVFVPLEAGVVKANKAYMPIALEGNVDAVGVDLESATGLRFLTEPGGDAPWYSISGMKVGRPNGKGIYIRNGRKIVVK